MEIVLFTCRPAGHVWEKEVTPKMVFLHKTIDGLSFCPECRKVTRVERSPSFHLMPKEVRIKKQVADLRVKIQQQLELVDKLEFALRIRYENNQPKTN